MFILKKYALLTFLASTLLASLHHNGMQIQLLPHKYVKRPLRFMQHTYTNDIFGGSARNCAKALNCTHRYNEKVNCFMYGGDKKHSYERTDTRGQIYSYREKNGDLCISISNLEKDKGIEINYDVYDSFQQKFKCKKCKTVIANSLKQYISEKRIDKILELSKYSHRTMKDHHDIKKLKIVEDNGYFYIRAMIETKYGTMFSIEQDI